MIDAEKRKKIYDFLKPHRFGVLSSVSADGTPEAALVGLAVTSDLDFIFETLVTTRKHENLTRDPRIALVIGWSGEKTAQCEGIAEIRDDAGVDDLKRTYYLERPENRSHEGWPGLTYIRVRPRWIRLSDYNFPWSVEEFRWDR
jgi:general stress protein 26